MTIRIFELPPKAGQVSASTKIPTEDPSDFTNATRMISASDLIPYTWAASDEDSPLTTGLLYTTEVASVARTIKDVIISLKNAPTGSSVAVDVLKETGVDTNVFTSILSTLPDILINEFSSILGTTLVSDTIWQVGRRLQFVLTNNDSNFAATGLKVTIKS